LIWKGADFSTSAYNCSACASNESRISSGIFKIKFERREKLVLYFAPVFFDWIGYRPSLFWLFSFNWSFCCNNDNRSTQAHHW
jgi:hypothetical protein